ncbi:MAG: tRNA (adenosine(37)-N6)-threonylcarbamoyltransferase complex transferase subunit TsaD [Bacteroidales bacterium]|nr:tRNA (adenosine(37)-N6)-threonylcarbamoyltransferase complex transferase subunit TsaD [Bacteroidales bacterium]
MMTTILAIESSCDDTSAAVLRDDRLLSNVIASQKVHEQYGGVVPELASRAHQQNIIPVVDAAIRQAGIEKGDIDAVGFTRGPGLLGSLLVGVSFAKSFATALGKPLIEVNHLQAHVLSHFIRVDSGECVVDSTRGQALPTTHYPLPSFPFICLLVSGGHTQILLLRSHFDIECLGTTIDDAAGEAIDKAAKIMDLGYPGGPVIDRLAKEGNPDAFTFATPHIEGYNYSFSGIKTSFLYFLRDRLKEDPDFIEHHKADLCASIQKTIVGFLLKKAERAALDHHVRQVAIAGGVSANSFLRSELQRICQKHHWQALIPPFQFCTDNAAMVGIAAYFKYLRGDFADISLPPYTR